MYIFILKRKRIVMWFFTGFLFLFPSAILLSLNLPHYCDSLHIPELYIMPDTENENHIEPNDIESQTQCNHCYCQQQNYNHDQGFFLSFIHFSFLLLLLKYNTADPIQIIILLRRRRVCEILAVKVKVNKLLLNR